MNELIRAVPLLAIQKSYIIGLLLCLFSCKKSVHSNWMDCTTTFNAPTDTWQIDSLGLRFNYPTHWQQEVKSDNEIILNFYYEYENSLVHISVYPELSGQLEKRLGKWKEPGKLDIGQFHVQYILDKEMDNLFLWVEVPDLHLSFLQILPQYADNQGFCELYQLLNGLEVFEPSRDSNFKPDV